MSYPYSAYFLVFVYTLPLGIAIIYWAARHFKLGRALRNWWKNTVSFNSSMLSKPRKKNDYRNFMPWER